PRSMQWSIWAPSFATLPSSRPANSSPSRSKICPARPAPSLASPSRSTSLLGTAYCRTTRMEAAKDLCAGVRPPGPALVGEPGQPHCHSEHLMSQVAHHGRVKGRHCSRSAARNLKWRALELVKFLTTYILNNRRARKNRGLGG